MPYRLLKDGKEHIGVINLDFKLDSIKHNAELQMGAIERKLNQSKGIAEHFDQLGHEVWKFEVISINTFSSADLSSAFFAINHVLSCPQYYT